MSADNFIAILKEGDKYVGYHCFASVEIETPCWKECYPCIGSKEFEVGSLEEALMESTNFGYLEYGNKWVDDRFDEVEEDFCPICAHRPNQPEEGRAEAVALGCNCKLLDFGGIQTGEDCPVHLNKRWQEKVGFRRVI